MIHVSVTLIVEACAKPFVSNVMQRLHQQVLRNAKQDVMRDLGECEDSEWDSPTAALALTLMIDAKFTEKTPVALTICAMSCNGIADCGLPHELKPQELQPCRLKNIPDACFSDCDGVSPALPLLLCPNPADIDNPKSSTFLPLHRSQPTPTEPHLTPFVVTRCEPSPPALQFHAVLCDSRSGHTAQLVQSFLSQQPPPLVFGNVAFAFWSLALNGFKFSERKHGVRNGHILRFDGGEGNS
jgi:hypothetical protein